MGEKPIRKRSQPPKIVIRVSQYEREEINRIADQKHMTQQALMRRAITLILRSQGKILGE